MASMQEQRDLANEIGAAISDPMNAGIDMDEVRFPAPLIYLSKSSDIASFPTLQDELKAELEEMEQEVLNERLSEADHAPVHLPPSSTRAKESKFGATQSPPLVLTRKYSQSNQQRFWTTKRLNSENSRRPWPCKRLLTLAHSRILSGLRVPLHRPCIIVSYHSIS